ncbi:hypothetical protein VUN82_11570 [Micrococcaceae bacterium Sec5.1]
MGWAPWRSSIRVSGVFIGAAGSLHDAVKGLGFDPLPAPFFLALLGMVISPCWRTSSESSCPKYLLMAKDPDYWSKDLERESEMIKLVQA